MSSTILALALRSTALLLASWALAVALRRASASSRNAVWRLSLLALLLMPIMPVRLPSWDVPVERVPLVSAAVQYVQAPPAPAKQAPRTPVNDALLAPTIAAAPIKPFEWASLIVPLWDLASALTLLPMLFGLVGLIRTLRRSRRLELAEFDTLCVALGIRKHVELRISDDLTTPATAGYFRPVVLIPNDALNWDSDRLGMDLRHELAHVLRADWPARILAHLACVVYAPNPIVWVANARLRAESEAACDDIVIAGGVNPKAYAKELLDIAREVRRTTLGVATVGMAHRSNVESRLRAIIDPRRRRASISRRAFVSLALCGLLAAGAITSLRFVVVHKHHEVGNQARKQNTFESFMRGIRDDVSDHPVIPPIQPGAKFTAEPYQPPPNHVTVARDGIAELPNGVRVALNGIAPTSTRDPIWDIANGPVAHVEANQNEPVAGYGDGTYAKAMERNLYFSITSDNATIASTMGYLFKPIPPESYEIRNAIYGQYGMDVKHNDFALDQASVHAVHLFVPGPPKLDRITYRVGVATGEWKTVLVVQNPYHGPVDPVKAHNKNICGDVTLQGLPCIIGPAEAGKRTPNARFAGDVNSSDLVARRALVLDSHGDLIRGEVSQEVGWYPLSYRDIRRCAHVVIQEREMEWAEFRDIPLRPTLEMDAKKAPGSIVTGTAQGIAPGYEAKVPGLGSVALAAVVTARKQGSAWTYDDQPRWRGDGKVLAEPSIPSGPGSPFGAPLATPPTEFRLQFAGSAWHGASTRIHIGNEDPREIPFGSDLPWTAMRCFDATVKDVTVAVDIADGPWQTVNSAEFQWTNPIRVVFSGPVRSNVVRDRQGAETNGQSGLTIVAGKEPMIQFPGESARTLVLIPRKDVQIRALPGSIAYRLVAVLKDETTHPLDLRGHVLHIPGKPGEDPQQESFDKAIGRRFFLATEIKQILYQARPMDREVKFEHVAVRPKM